MKSRNPFDTKLETHKGHLPPHTVDSMVRVTHTLDFAWASVQSVFEEAATPEHALKVCELMLSCIHRQEAGHQNS